MSEQENKGTLVNVKRVRRGTDHKEREQVVITLGLDKEGNNSLDKFIEAVAALRGKQANFDIRFEKKTTDKGYEFESAFLIVKEMIPKDVPQARFVPKTEKKAADLKKRANAIKAELE